MRELLFKNLTSREKRRKVFYVSEVAEKDGFLAHTRRYFIYLIKESQNIREALSSPRFYILKIRNHKEKREKLFFKVKGNFYVVNNNCLYIVYFCHSLEIELSQSPHTSHSKPL